MKGERLLFSRISMSSLGKGNSFVLLPAPHTLCAVRKKAGKIVGWAFGERAYPHFPGKGLFELSAAV